MIFLNLNFSILAISAHPHLRKWKLWHGTRKSSTVNIYRATNVRKKIAPSNTRRHTIWRITYFNSTKKAWPWTKWRSTITQSPIPKIAINNTYIIDNSLITYFLLKTIAIFAKNGPTFVLNDTTKLKIYLTINWRYTLKQLTYWLTLI